MKLRLTEQQVRNLVEQLNQPNLPEFGDIDIEKIAPNLTKLAKFVMNPQTSIDTVTTTASNNVTIPFHPDTQSGFAKDIPKGNEMMHPLGRKTKITSGFGQRSSSVGSKNHKGIDIGTASGSAVYAPLDGVVTASRDTTPNGCGGYVRIEHATMITKFCHLRQLVAKEGAPVKKGQLIGYSGGGKTDPMRGTATGPHLHYEILNKGGLAMNPTSVQHNLAEGLKKKSANKIDEFAKFVKKELKIQHPPTIIVTDKKDGIKTTANYDYGTDHKVMKIYAKNRMSVDVMRSIAHELIHHKQWEDGKLEVKPPDIGGTIEDEANAVAGQLIKKFAKIDSTIYDE